MNMKKLCVLFLSMMLVVGCSTKPKAIVDGTYEGEAKGNNGPIQVQVEIKDGKLNDVILVSQSETKGLGDVAILKIIETMKTSGSSAVDSISGATVSSQGVVEATRNAMKLAGYDDAYFSSEEKVSVSTVAMESEYTSDVVVIGGGGAGLSAAIEAAQTGAKVILIEKTPASGGNTLVSGGGLNVPGTKQQIANGIEDSVELFYEDTMKGGDNESNPELVRVMAENALDTANWLIDDIKVEFMEDRLQQFGGHSLPRALISKGNKGDELIAKLEAAALEAGVTIYYETKGEELIMDNDQVVGVKATNQGKEITFHTDKGVILATGGFASNLDMRLKYNDDYGANYMSTATAASTGDGIVMAEKVNAHLVDMDYIQVYPTCNPVTGIISYVANSRFDGAVLVNQEGKRFIDEMGRRDVISNAIVDQSGSYAYLVWGKEVEEVGKMTEVHALEYQAWVDSDLLYKAESIEDAAKHYGISVEEMMKTIDDYNASIADGKDEEFNRGGALKTINEGPFYIQKVVPSTHHTMGGIDINTQAQVLDNNSNVIKNLYAAGEVVGGIHGTNRLGGNAITDILVFGRIAGQNVVK